MVGYKLRVNNVYGTINRTIDTDAFFLKAMFGGLVKAFGSSIKVESTFHENPTPEEAPRRVMYGPAPIIAPIATNDVAAITPNDIAQVVNPRRRKVP